MLTDALVERYSRQILLPDVGGRGQERLCAAHVTVDGDGPAAALATELLAAAGVGVTHRTGDPATVTVLAGDAGTVVGRIRGGAAVVVTLVGRPCRQCAPPGLFDLADGVEPEGGDAAFLHAAGALVAAETLRVLLGLVGEGRRHHLDPSRDVFEGRPLPIGAGCPGCAGAA
jgi:hypothetical protein